MKLARPITFCAFAAVAGLAIGYYAGAQQPFQGVRSTELAAADLGKHFACLSGMVLKMTRHEVAAGAGGSEHSHQGRPEVFYVLDGKIVEHQGAKSREYNAGEGFVSNADLSVPHRIVNESSQPALVMDVQIIAAER